MDDKRIFDEYQVDCNDCQHYWTDTCDGVKQGSTKACTSFLATRQTNIPEQIKKLEKSLIHAHKCIFALAVAQLITNLLLIAKGLGWL